MQKLKLEGLSLLGYKRAGASGNPARAVNPATGVELEPGYHWGTVEDVENAVELAAQAFRQFGHWPAKRRAELLRRIADGLEANAAPILERANQETALPLPRLQGEMARTCGQLRLFGSLIEDGWWLDARVDHGNPERKPLPKPDVRSMLVPLGPVAVFSSSNFPLAFSVAGGDTASALAAGCPVIVKPHHGHLGTSELVGQVVQQAAQDCSAPDGVFSMLFGPGRQVGLALVKHPQIKAVGFTGSRAGGRALMDAAAARPVPIPVYTEMGSINPVFLLPRALQERTSELASGLHASVTLGVGQFCTNPGLVFMQDSPATQDLLRELKERMAATPPGTMLTTDICSAYHEGISKFSKVPGVHCLTEESGASAPGSKVRATLFQTAAPTFLANPVLMDEVFGPSTLVVICSSPAQMFEMARGLEGQLTATVHATPEDLQAHRELLEILQTKAGRLVSNSFPTGVEVCHAMVHGGPYPATADGRSTSVGTRAIERFARPVCFQGFPDQALPDELKEGNPLGIWRLVDGRFGQL